MTRLTHRSNAEETTPLLRDQTPHGPDVSRGDDEVEEIGHPNHANDEVRGGDDDGPESDSQDPSTQYLLAINASVWIGVFFAALDTTVVATLTGPISSSFNSLSLLSWLATGYLIANSACQPLSGKLTDIFGRRAGLIFSNFFFAVGTLMCGLAPSAGVIIAGRVIAGIGGGGLTCIATFVQSDLIPLRRRGLWQGFGNLVFGMGMGLGGVFGGLCADRLSWRWAFLIQVPFIVVSTVLIWFLLDLPILPHHEGSKASSLKRIDFLGAGLLVTSLVLLLLGLNTGGNQLPWKHPLVIVALVLAAVTMAGFLYVESTPSIVKEPLIPVSLVIRTRTVWAACLTNWFTTMSAFIALYYVPLYLEVIRQTSPTAAGLRVMPFAAGISLGSIACGLIMRTTGRYYYLLVLSMTFYIVGSSLLCTLTVSTPNWPTYIYVTPMGLGYGSMLTITLVGMISAVEHQHQALITAASYAFRSTGSTVGVTIASAVFQNLLTSKLRLRYGTSPESEKIIDRIRNSLDEIHNLPPGWSEDVVRGVYMDALRGSFVSGLGLAVLAGLVALMMREHVLHGNLSRK